MQALPFELPKFEPGWVWLAGAGPGDVGLLTLHALNALRQADVLVYDALVGKEILDLVSGDCELEYAGKRGGKPSAKQRDISLRLVELAEQGKRVLRLKGGDPFVFGRGGEEALCLATAKIPFRIIPGISAGIGGLAYAGIPLTHRDINSAVTFITGHGMAGELPERHNWDAIAQGSPVIVMYMAMKYLGEIAEQGKRVLRLKGGDPFVFGRGGEEALCLATAKIPFRIIPGISAGIGGLAYAGIPLTHRDINSAVTFITGHGMAGELPERHNWDAIAQGSPVIVMYMAMKYLGEIAVRLMRNGRSTEEPVAVISQASLPDQRVLETKLGTCAVDVEKHGLEPPAMIVVGEVVSLREFLKWMD